MYNSWIGKISCQTSDKINHACIGLNLSVMIRMSSNGDGFCKREKSQQAEIRSLPTWMNIPVCKDEGIMDCAKISYSSKVKGGHKKIRKERQKWKRPHPIQSFKDNHQAIIVSI